jgi:hypothetical protein
MLMICDFAGVGTCQGDSGGGFYTQHKTSDGLERWTLRGVVKGSVKLRKDQDDCLENTFFTFTDTKVYLPWIRKIMDEGESFCCLISNSQCNRRHAT